MCVVMRSPCGSRSAWQSCFVSAIVSAKTSHIATLQPSTTSCRTSSRPMPVPPPVTTAILPANSFIGGLLSDAAHCVASSSWDDHFELRTHHRGRHVQPYYRVNLQRKAPSTTVRPTTLSAYATCIQYITFPTGNTAVHRSAACRLI